MFNSFVGSHYEFGKYYGAMFSKRVKASTEADKKEVHILGTNWQDMQIKIQEFMKPTAEIFPDIYEELLGFAYGAGVDITDLFINITEELFDKAQVERCTDIVIGDSKILVGHNNDVDPSLFDDLTFVRYSNGDGYNRYIAGFWGIFPATGFNDYLYLGGDELLQDDVKAGVPREILVRAVLETTTIEEAVRICCLAERASSYNNIIVTRSGVVRLIEGTATEFEEEFYDGKYAHTNHYKSQRLRKHAAFDDIDTSIIRLERAQLLVNLSEVREVSTVKRILADHESTPCLCRHDSNVRTLFSIVGDIDLWKFEICNGNPCDSEFEIWN